LNYTNLHTKNWNQSFETKFLMFLELTICINRIWPQLFVIYDHKSKHWLKCAHRKHWLISMCSSLMLKKNALKKKETCQFRDSSPATLTIGKDEIDELPVFFCSPWPFFQSYFVATRLPSHNSLSKHKCLRESLRE